MKSIDALRLAHGEITDQILRAFYTVHTHLGFGFAENIYKRAMAIELAKLGLNAQREVDFIATYDEVNIGEYQADLVVEEKILVEVKTVTTLAPSHRGQLLNYLRVSEIPVGLLLNFGPRAQVRRLTVE